MLWLSREHGARPVGASPVGASPFSQNSFYRVRTTAPVRSARPKLLNNLGYDAGTNRFSTFADSKTYAFIDRNRLLKLDNQANVVARHAHFRFGKVCCSCNVRCAEVKLWSITREERGMAPTLFLTQAINFRIEFLVRGDRVWLGQNLTTLDVFTANTA